MAIKFGHFANFIVRNFVVIWEAPTTGGSTIGCDRAARGCGLRHPRNCGKSRDRGAATPWSATGGGVASAPLSYSTYVKEAQFGSVRLRFGDGTVQAVPVFGSGGSSAKRVFCVSAQFNRKGRFRFRLRFLENGFGGSGSAFGIGKNGSDGSGFRFRFGS